MTALLWNRATNPAALLVLAHGAGAPMDSDFMETLAQGLAENGISVVRFEFPYMQRRREDGKKRPPNPAGQLLAHFQSVVETVADPALPVWVGGKSMGGRMASMLAAQQMANIAGVAAFGYPFHPPGKPEKTRTEHLPQLLVPMLVCQGQRDPFGKPDEVSGYGLPEQVHLHWLTAGDHDFKPLKASGLDQQTLIAEAAEHTATFIRG
ncbi:MAG: alpha/beta hydrolase [Pseudomonadales bacterium]|nr:alpha/beta hydrolase [Pseudomonadales bacterium]